MKFKTFIALLLLTGLYTNNLFAQFGQNKVQYKLFDWHFIQTTHFDIYFDYKSPEIAEFTAYIAERSLDDLQNKQ